MMNTPITSHLIQRLQRIGLLLLSALVLNAAGAAESVVYYHNDALGSPVAATDEAGQLVWQESYMPYGDRIKKEDGGTNDLWYTGKPHEESFGLSYFGARWYDPLTGRFMGIDPVGFDEGNPQSFNRYAYANNNPYRFIDPDGLAPKLWTGGTPPRWENLRGSSGGGLGNGYGVLNQGSGVRWKEGWRTPDGKYASPQGPGRSGENAEKAVWNAIRTKKDGWTVIEGRVSVRNKKGELRVYDGLAVSPRGRAIGLEIKSGTARKTPHQRNFDRGVNSYNPAVGVGKSKGYSVRGTLEINLPTMTPFP